MNKKVSLVEMLRTKIYRIAGFRKTSPDYAEKLSKMGFTLGTPVTFAPVKISDPIVVQIRGSRIALRKKEAQAILVEEMDHA